jgi:SatD family (SatD)
MPDVTSVLIADVILSSRQPRLRALLRERLRRASRTHLREGRIRLPYAVTAGDEFQVVPASIELIPELLFDLRRILCPLGLRIGVGIGRIQGPLKAPVNHMEGEAFVFARQAIDDVKHQSLHRFPTLTAFRSGRKTFDRLANLVYGLSDTLLLNVTAAQWRTIDVYFAKRRVDRTARALKVDTSTSSRNLKRGKYWQLAEAAETMKTILREAWQ